MSRDQGGPNGDYMLDEISEIKSGFKLVWEYLGVGGESVEGETTQPPEEDAGAYI